MILSFRIPRDQQWNEQKSGTYWFIPSNQIPELVPIKHPSNDIQVRIFCMKNLEVSSV